MSKPKHPRGLADTEAQAITHNIRVSPMKLNLVAAMIRGAKAQDAVATLTFSKRRIAQTVKKTLEARSPMPRTITNWTLIVSWFPRQRLVVPLL